MADQRKIRRTITITLMDIGEEFSPDTYGLSASVIVDPPILFEDRMRNNIEFAAKDLLDTLAIEWGIVATVPANSCFKEEG